MPWQKIEELAQCNIQRARWQEENRWKTYNRKEEVEELRYGC